MIQKNTYHRNNNPDYYNHNPYANCGSFALNVKEWFHPFANLSDDDNLSVEDFGWDETTRYEMISDLLFSGCTREEIMEALVVKDWEYILAKAPWLEEININEAAPSDRIIAYRVAVELEPDCEGYALSDDDFHFRVRINGFWFDKCGAKELRFLGTEVDEEPWWDDMCYDSSIKYARFKEI